MSTPVANTAPPNLEIELVPAVQVELPLFPVRLPVMATPPVLLLVMVIAPEMANVLLKVIVLAPEKVTATEAVAAPPNVMAALAAIACVPAVWNVTVPVPLLNVVPPMVMPLALPNMTAGFWPERSHTPFELIVTPPLNVRFPVAPPDVFKVPVTLTAPVKVCAKLPMVSVPAVIVVVPPTVNVAAASCTVVRVKPELLTTRLL